MPIRDPNRPVCVGGERKAYFPRLVSWPRRLSSHLRTGPRPEADPWVGRTLTLNPFFPLDSTSSEALTSHRRAPSWLIGRPAWHKRVTRDLLAKINPDSPTQRCS